MNLEEKKQIYLDRFPAIIGKRMSEQVNDYPVYFEQELSQLIDNFNLWEDTIEGDLFWSDIRDLYFNNSAITHQSILDIFNFHNIKP